MSTVEKGRNDDETPSLIVPIQSSEDLFVEIFPEEMTQTSPVDLLQVLKNEKADTDIWTYASLLYMQQKRARESLTILEEAPIDKDRNKRVQVLASTGIAHLAVNNNQEDADEMFTKAGKMGE